MPAKKNATTTAPATLPTLPAIAENINRAGANIQEAHRQFERTTLADNVWIGVQCLAAQEHHALAPANRGQGRKGKKKEIKSHVGRDLEKAHPQGFEQWVADEIPWLKKTTYYRYMDAAVGAGLTSLANEEETQRVVSDLLTEHDRLSMKALIDMKNLMGAEKEADTKKGKPKGGGQPSKQLTFEMLTNYEAYCTQVAASRNSMSAAQIKVATERSAATLEALTGNKWGPLPSE